MTPRARVLVVDDKPSNVKLFAEVLSAAHDVDTAAGGTEALAALDRQAFDVVVSDIRMPGMDGLTLLEQIRARHPDVQVVLLTAFGSVPKAVEAMKKGAHDYLTKPVDPDDLEAVVARAVDRARLRAAAQATPTATFAGLVGTSPVMQRLFHLMTRAAASDVTVLITGESGTGKELVARGVHAESRRAARPFVPLNCGAIPEALLESELFGHVKGAFTGADADRAGLFEAAEGGTLFLDEVADLPLALQVKLNRALQERAVRPVGGAGERRFDVRILAATNVDLEAAVRAGTFREDLYYRLAVFPITTPPLRARADDIPALAAALLARQANPAVEGFTEAALEALVRRAWPGNVRELDNAVTRAAAVAEGPRIDVGDLAGGASGTAPTPGVDVPTALPFRDAVEQVRAEASRQYLEQLMTEFEGNVTRAAARARMERESLHRLLKKHGVRPKDFRRDD